ncbi:transposon Tf2-9 polyprotein [Trichonephila clavipes]|nr:transposon Tf2-9 polyprotein [Trichonephila clavipes]
MRERIVLGIKHRGLQERLLRENNLNIEKAIEIVRVAEASREQIRNVKYDTATINFVKENQNKPETQYNCKKCGRKHKPRECPAFGKICAKCKKKPHFAAKCFQSTKNIHEMNIPKNELVYIDSVNENETKCAMKNSTDSNFKNVEMVSETNCQCKIQTGVLGLRGCKELKLIERIDAIECSIGCDEDLHDAIMSRVLERAKFLNIKFNPDKLQYRVSEVKYAGQIIFKSGIKPDSDYIKAIVEIPTPKSKTEVVRLLGMMNILSKFIPNVSKVTAPLREIIHENVEFNWGKEQEFSFVNIK